MGLPMQAAGTTSSPRGGDPEDDAHLGTSPYVVDDSGFDLSEGHASAKKVCTITITCANTS